MTYFISLPPFQAAAAAAVAVAIAERQVKGSAATGMKASRLFEGNGHAEKDERTEED